MQINIDIHTDCRYNITGIHFPSCIVDYVVYYLYCKLNLNSSTEYQLLYGILSLYQDEYAGSNIFKCKSLIPAVKYAINIKN